MSIAPIAPNANAFDARLPHTDPARVGLDAARLQRISDWLRGEIARAQLPGAVWMVARQGKVAWVDAVGQLGPNLDTDTGADDGEGGTITAAPAMSADALFRIYSMTKPVVSLAVMQLVEQGRLLLTDAVSQWLPAFQTTQVAVERGAEVHFEPVRREATVQDLLRHTAGLTYEFLGNAHVHRRYAQARIASRGRTNAEFCEALASLPYAHQPGSVWDYSRATDVAGRLIEVVTGQTLDTYLRDHVFAPLGMHETGFVVDTAQQHRIAEPWAIDPVDGLPIHLLDPRVAPAMASGGGGLISTLADYSRFTAMLGAGGVLDGTRVLSRTTLQLMTADHLGAIPSVCDLLAPGHGFGLGFAVRTAPGLSSQPGSVGSYYWSGIAGTSFFVDPAEQLSAILLTQAPGHRLRYRLTFRNMVYAALSD